MSDVKRLLIIPHRIPIYSEETSDLQFVVLAVIRSPTTVQFTVWYPYVP